MELKTAIVTALLSAIAPINTEPRFNGTSSYLKYSNEQSSLDYMKLVKPPNLVLESRLQPPARRKFSIQPPSSRLLPPVIIPSSNFSTKLSEEELINKANEIRDENTVFFDDYDKQSDEYYQDKSYENFDEKSSESYNEKSAEKIIVETDVTKEYSNEEETFDDDLDDYNFEDNELTLSGEDESTTKYALTTTNTALKTNTITSMIDEKVDNPENQDETSKTDVAVTNGDRASYGMISKDSESYVSLSVEKTDLGTVRLLCTFESKSSDMFKEANFVPEIWLISDHGRCTGLSGVVKAVKLAYIIGRGTGTVDVSGLAWEDLRGKCMVILKRKPLNDNTTENTIDVDEENIIGIDETNIIDIDETNIIDVDDKPEKSAKKRRKSSKPKLVNSRISYFDYNSGEERQFSSSELRLKKISYFDSSSEQDIEKEESYNKQKISYFDSNGENSINYNNAINNKDKISYFDSSSEEETENEIDDESIDTSYESYEIESNEIENDLSYEYNASDKNEIQEEENILRAALFTRTIININLGNYVVISSGYSVAFVAPTSVLSVLDSKVIINQQPSNTPTVYYPWATWPYWRIPEINVIAATLATLGFLSLLYFFTYVQTHPKQVNTVVQNIMRLEKVERGLKKLDDIQDRVGKALYNALDNINPFKDELDYEEYSVDYGDYYSQDLQGIEKIDRNVYDYKYLSL